MYFLIILLFISFAGAVAMIINKLMLIKNGSIPLASHSHPFVPELQKIKYIAFKNMNRIGYVTVFFTLKFFIKSSNFVKMKSKEIKKIISEKFERSEIPPEENKKEASNYLKVISEYRHKIRKIKHMIKEEEGIE